MASYKSQVLHQAYRGRLRPRSHYALGWLPRWARLAGVAPGLANAALRARPVAGVARRLAGIDPRRPLPEFARHPARPARLRALASAASTAPGPQRGRVLLWVDTFTRTFSPAVAESAAAVLAEAGFEVIVPDRPSCCGLTWISTGQLGGARVRLRATVDRLAGHAEQGTTIVGLEPSCTAVLRGDLTELLGGDPRARAVAEHSLLPALRAAPERAVLLADGFSCRTQAAQLAGWPALHLAQLLDARAGGTG